MVKEKKVSLPHGIPHRKTANKLFHQMIDMESESSCILNTII